MTFFGLAHASLVHKLQFEFSNEIKTNIHNVPYTPKS